MAIADDIARLQGILAAGVLKTRLADGKEITFADVHELKARIDYLKGVAAGPASRKTATTYATFSGRR